MGIKEAGKDGIKAVAKKRFWCKLHLARNRKGYWWVELGITLRYGVRGRNEFQTALARNNTKSKRGFEES